MQGSPLAAVCVCARARVCVDRCNSDGVATAAYNTPENLNCLSPSLTAETFLVLEHAARDDACKVLICKFFA